MTEQEGVVHKKPQFTGKQANIVLCIVFAYEYCEGVAEVDKDTPPVLVFLNKRLTEWENFVTQCQFLPEQMHICGLEFNPAEITEALKFRRPIIKAYRKIIAAKMTNREGLHWLFLEMFPHLRNHETDESTVMDKFEGDDKQRLSELYGYFSVENKVIFCEYLSTNKLA